MEHLPNIHPGETLQEEFLTELNLTAYRLAQDVGIPQNPPLGDTKAQAPHYGRYGPAPRPLLRQLA